MLQFRNQTARFLWGFTSVWLLMLIAMTWVVLRDGAPSGYHPLFIYGVMLMFWASGIGLGNYAFKQPCLDVRIEGLNLYITEAYPLLKKHRHLPLAQVSPAQLVESTDSEGDPYFYARIALEDGTVLNLSEGSQRETCQAACESFNHKLAQVG